MSRRIQIFDTTLRDGEQSPGIALRPHEKAEIAEQLERLGVDVIEAGFAGASPGDFEGVRAVAASVQAPVVASLVRAHRDDIDAAAEALAGAVRSRIHIVLGTSPIHMEKKLGLEPAEVLEQARWAVEYSAALVDEVEFSCEDATRSDPAFVARVCRVAIAPARRSSIFPTPSATRCPPSTPRSSPRCAGAAASCARSTLSVHCHNDLGLAVANSLAGIQAGAQQVECTINGLGERAGNASLEEIVMALHVRADHFDVETGIETEQITATSRLVAALHGIRRAAEQGDRRRQRFRARSRHPPGRDAEGRADVPDHRSGVGGRRDDAPARQALRPPRVRACVRGAGQADRRRRARPGVSPIQGARGRRRRRDARRCLPGGDGMSREAKVAW